MVNYKFLLNNFENKHQVINNLDYLDMYINFLLSYQLPTDSDYTEKHHILPSSTFPEFKFEKWNIVEISYDHHRIVHLWLYKSINIREYQRPLNWMLKNYKNTQELSNASKLGWIKLKNNEKKYKDWSEKRSKHMKSLSSDEQRRRAKIFWQSITDEEYVKFCEKLKNKWTDDKKLEKSNSMKKYYSDQNNKIKKSDEQKKRWESVDEQYRLDFKKKMSIINKDINKRKLAGKIIKDLWSSEDYLNKMKNRKTNPGIKIKIIHSDGTEIIFEKMKEVIDKYNFSAHLIRKYRDTNIEIAEEHLNESNLILLNAKIESIKN